MSASARVKALASLLDEESVDAFLAWDPISMGYLAGFHEGAHERFLTLAIRRTGEMTLICPALTETQARRCGIDQIRPWADGDDPLALFAALAKEWNLESAIVAVDATMPARQLLQLQDVLPAALFRNGESLLSRLMRVKDSTEWGWMGRAGKIADEAFNEVNPQIRAGMTEREVSRMLSDAMIARGGKPTFSIVATGANGAEPHHLTDDTVLRSGDVMILDFGCDLHGYQSDITRTVAVEHPSDEAQQVYDIVFRAHMAARAAIAPGITGEAVDAAARKVIVDAGYGPQFFHRTGHGIGMNGHEAPNIVAGNTEPLEAGNCFSIEPGIYLAGRFGVRIENIVGCTMSGHESFNEEPSPVLLVVG